jgi:hypothetical protein
VLPLLILAFASPLAPHEQSAVDCHPNAPAGIALSQGDSSTPCDHNADTACATMLGCVVLPSAVASVASRFSAQATVAVAAPFGNCALHGRLGLGPPTPPPNS